MDPKELNKIKKRNYLLILTLNDIKSKLVNKRFFMVIDIKKGFWHIELDSKSGTLCTFSSSIGYFKFLRTPCDISCAPEDFIK